MEAGITLRGHTGPGEHWVATGGKDENEAFKEKIMQVEENQLYQQPDLVLCVQD